MPWPSYVIPVGALRPTPLVAKLPSHCITSHLNASRSERFVSSSRGSKRGAKRQTLEGGGGGEFGRKGDSDSDSNDDDDDEKNGKEDEEEEEEGSVEKEQTTTRKAMTNEHSRGRRQSSDIKGRG